MSNMRSENLKITNYPGLVIERMEGKDWQQIMQESLNMLAEEGFEVQPGSGTLLGLAREEDGYIHHDTDIDLDIIERKSNREDFQERIMSIMERFINAGYKLVRTQIYLGLPMQMAFIKTSNNLIVDFCFFYDEWGTDWLNIYEHGVFIRPPYSINETTEYEFKGMKYKAPNSLDKYLTGRYGDWETPKTYKLSGEKDASNYLVAL